VKRLEEGERNQFDLRNLVGPPFARATSPLQPGAATFGSFTVSLKESHQHISLPQLSRNLRDTVRPVAAGLWIPGACQDPFSFDRVKIVKSPERVLTTPLCGIFLRMRQRCSGERGSGVSGV
jgi:hypothetical protein